MDKMSSDGFLVLRVNESLNQAKTVFSLQSLLKKKLQAYDFSLVIPYCDAITKVKKNAYDARDAISVFQNFYSSSRQEGANYSSVEEIVSEINEEMNDERYEQIDALVNKAYDEVTFVNSQYSSLGVFYSATTRGVLSFFKDNWLYLVSSAAVILVLYLIFRKPIKRFSLKKRIRRLQFRKKSLKDMLMQTQRDYFNFGKISEGTFNIRTKKLGELIRDIDRQLPLLEEEMIKLSGRRNKTP
jgi:uncharacterized membrane protein